MRECIHDYTVLNNGIKMPWLGFGVYKISNPEELDFAVKKAIETGYRLIDTASAYGNEADVGKAIKESGVPREKIFVTTKLWNEDQLLGYDRVLKAFDESRKRLGLEYIDLYLIHWAKPGKYVDSWRALIRLYQEGLVRAIGVSNFMIHHLEDIIMETGMVPAVDQIEHHPWLTRKALVEYCKSKGIQVEAHSPLLRGKVNEVPEIGMIAEKYAKTPAQIVLRWNLQHRIVVIPKSIHENRIIENSAIFDFELTDEDMKIIDGLNQDKRFGGDPDNVTF